MGKNEHQPPVTYDNAEGVKMSAGGALLVRWDGVEAWVPCKAIHPDSDVNDEGDKGILALHAWFSGSFDAKIKGGETSFAKKSPAPGKPAPHPTPGNPDGLLRLALAKLTEARELIEAAVAANGKPKEAPAVGAQEKPPQSCAGTRSSPDDDLPFRSLDFSLAMSNTMYHVFTGRRSHRRNRTTPPPLRGPA